MSQTVFDTINAATTSGTQLTVILGDFKNALMSGLIGNTRPSQLQAGGSWIDNSLEAAPNYTWTYKIYTGGVDVTVFKINLSTNTASIAGSDSSFVVTKISADSAGALAQLVKQRIANGGQVLAGDTIGEIQFIGRTDASGAPLVARIRSVATEAETASANGANIIFETTTTSGASLSEVMRIMDGKVGIGTTAPTQTLHVKGTGVRSERVTDDTTGSRVILRKARVTGTGQVQSGDYVGGVEFASTDNVSAEFTAGSVSVQASEAHTASARGTTVRIRNIKVGSPTLADAVVVTDGVEVVTPLTVNAEVLSGQTIAASAGIISLSATKRAILITGSINTLIQGINAAGPSKLILIHNASTGTVTLSHLDAAASTTNQIKLPSARNLVVAPDSSISLFYSTADSYWKITSGATGVGLADVITSKGDIIAGGTSGVPTRVPAGTDGTLVKYDSTQTSGLGTATDQGAIVNKQTTKGDLIAYSTAPIRFGVGTDGQILVADSAQTTGLRWSSPPQVSPLTTAGDLYTYDTANQRFPVGTLGQVLTVDTTQPTKLKWASPQVSPLTTFGDLYAFGTTNTRVPLGSQGQSLVVDTTQTAGLKYVLPASPGLKNYLGSINGTTRNGDFEQGIANWARGNVALVNNIPSGTPTIGSGFSGTLTTTAVTTGQLSGTTSLSFANSAAMVAGDFLYSPTFSIDASDQARVLKWSFNYKCVVNNGANFSGTSANSFGVAIYDLSASAWVQSTTGIFSMSQSVGVGQASGTFQTSATSTQYRLHVYCANATTGATTLYVDDFFCGPQSASVLGANIFGSNPYVANTANFGGFGVPTAQNLRWTQIGEEMECRGTFTMGTAGASGGRIPLPAGFSIDLSKFTTNAPAGFIYVNGSTVNTHSLLVDFANNGSTYLSMGTQGTGNANNGWLNLQVVTAALGNNTSLGVYFKVPIVGWTSNAVRSSDTDTRVIAMRAHASGSSTSTATTPFVFDVVDFDVMASYSNTTGKYTVPVSGYYHVSHSGYATVAGVTATVYVNNVAVPGGGLFSYNTGDIRGGAVTVRVNAGDTIDIRTSTSRTLAADATTNFLSIERLSGPQVLLAADSVNMRYSSSTSAISGTASTIIFTTNNFDSSNAYSTSTGLYTVPLAGKYFVSSSVYVNATRGSGATDSVIIQKNLVDYNATVQILNNYSGLVSTKVTDVIQCVPGDTIRIQASSNGGSPTVTANIQHNYLTIVRVGN